MSKKNGNKTLEEIVHICIQKTESDILRMNDWSLDLPTGSNILSMILKLCNDDYNFQVLLMKVEKKALEKMFSGDRRVS